MVTATPLPLREVVQQWLEWRGYLRTATIDLATDSILASAEFTALQQRVAALEAAARDVLRFTDDAIRAGNKQGHPGEPHDNALYDPRIPTEVYGDCAACAGAEYGAEDSKNMAVIRLRLALGDPLQPYEEASREAALLAPEPACAVEFVHPPSQCRCECGKLLRTHKPLPKPEWKTWRTDHGAQPQFAQKGQGITISHQPLDAGDGHCVACGKRVARWGDARLRHVREAA